MVFDSQRTKPSSMMTGTIPFGLSDRNSGTCVERKPAPHSSCSKGRSSSSQTHRTLRTLMDGDLPRILSMVFSFRDGGPSSVGGGPHAENATAFELDPLT